MAAVHALRRKSAHSRFWQAWAAVEQRSSERAGWAPVEQDSYYGTRSSSKQCEWRASIGSALTAWHDFCDLATRLFPRVFVANVRWHCVPQPVVVNEDEDEAHSCHSWRVSLSVSPSSQPSPGEAQRKIERS